MNTRQRKKEEHNRQGRRVFLVGVVCKPLRATLGLDAAGMRIRPPKGAGMVRHSVGQLYGQVGRGARLWRVWAGLSRTSCGLGADDRAVCTQVVPMAYN
ncbi:UNVERIFIED_CONTAM: hypothetical protein Sradi_5113600 [Sesamum radiatum]|uniref:Uncharacterized protein n=1 Tax=Sesamum radiatum TaxID=300843 RepID=A0AAW2M379_SESRA